ncbi:Acetylcholinesterase Short=AChE [Rhizoctonia solani AG-1 IB]|uniref:Acetylcholinesterase Short=AChE n=3 Tax=Thanatephorus cucumeris (strain AG1-IB / isolate 7/3/14) TaxID=1108050 RepID=M5C2D3_THACB|nr:Acetylcholinesterase Short=AChE [Rhizoctonia solani AG-1 IB]
MIEAPPYLDRGMKKLDAPGLILFIKYQSLPSLITMVFWGRASALLACAPLINVAALSVRDASAPSDGLLVNTASGKVQGFYNNTAHTVRAFLGVPFAAAPIGSARFLPPQAHQSSSSVIQATSWPPSCPGLFNGPPLVTFSSLPYFPIAGFNEDCLTVNVWTPSASRFKKAQLLPVSVYIYGGSFDEGGTSIPAYEATNLVANQDIVVVTLNYRVTIFGNPNSPYLASKGGPVNVGLLDQRFAIEWLQKNVASFGGDPKRMIAFGQSAGSISAGFMPFAYPKNPIVTGVGELSASTLIPGDAIVMPGIAQGNFTDIASAVGCAPGNTTDKQIFECMQNVPWKTLTDHIIGHPEKNYLFRIVADGITAFKDIPARIAAGKLAKIPQFNGQLENEGDSLVPSSPDGIDHAAADAFGYALLVCPAAREAQLRVDAGLKTFRYRYTGIYPNLSPYPFLRTYHTSDVPMWFGSVNTIKGLKENTTAEQKKQSAYMQGALAAFTKDPEQGLIKYGWPLYQGSKGKTLVHLDPRNSSELVVFESPAEFDAPCGSA